ncbi:hypothetical protein ACFWZ2_23415 [Streptomyces sp. NPDC059002]|uniref:hypothetical protein n=1 Tax=Streptomyces sp. NPDC059002 TaxID=3346690 RepID=UPI0036AAAE2D
MYISPRALDGSRRHRLVVGTMLFLGTGGIGTGLLIAMFAAGTGMPARTGLGAGAVAFLTVAWWCARYWYAAFCTGRREPPVPEPNPWPWTLPWAVATVALLVTGVRQVAAGESSGWFALGFGGLLGLPITVLSLLTLYFTATESRRTERATARRPAPEPPRPRRDWGPIG